MIYLHSVNFGCTPSVTVKICIQRAETGGFGKLFCHLRVSQP